MIDFDFDSAKWISYWSDLSPPPPSDIVQNLKVGDQ